MPRLIGKQSMFDIHKFCNGEGSTCNNIENPNIVTAGNNPSASQNMQYSQLLRSRKFTRVHNMTPETPPVQPPVPFYRYATGYIFVHPRNI